MEEKLYRFMLYVADKYDKELERKMNEIAGKGRSSGSSRSGGASGSGSSSKKGGGLLGGLGSGLGGGLLGGDALGGVGGGLLGGLGGALEAILPAAGMGLDMLKNSGVQDLVTQASGPVLAAGASAFGFPELAPVLMQVGPSLAEGAFGLANTAVEWGEGASGGGAPSASRSASSALSEEAEEGAGSGSRTSSSSASSASGSARGEPDVTKKDMLELEHLQEKQKEMFSLVSNLLRAMHDTKMAVVNNIRA